MNAIKSTIVLSFMIITMLTFASQTTIKASVVKKALYKMQVIR